MFQAHLLRQKGHPECAIHQLATNSDYVIDEKWDREAKVCSVP